MRKRLVSAGVVLVAAVVQASPVVTVSSVTQSDNGTVTVSYSLNEAAVVTMDVQTNAGNGVWLSIGGKNVSGTCAPSGDVFRRVGAGERAFAWDPDYAASDVGFALNGSKCRITVRAWPEDDLPDYMTVRLARNLSQADRVSFYPGVDYLPGGLFENNSYRSSVLVMRRIPAAGRVFLMGYTHGQAWDVGGNVSKPHQVAMDCDYYMSIFELTVAQQLSVGATHPSFFSVERFRRPADALSYGVIREGGTHAAAADAPEYPQAPAANSVLGLLRDRTGVAFDLPTEAQWEFACKAGEARDQYWNTGALIGPEKDRGATMPGRCLYNQPGGSVSEADMKPAYGPTNGTALVGSYAPNAWGLYDMHGNVCEWCLDWHADDITGLNGAPNANGRYLADGKTVGEKRVSRGGSWALAAYCAESEYRAKNPPDATSHVGLRPVCPADIYVRTRAGGGL